MSGVVPILLDTDIGSDIDDAVCLAYLLAQPRCRLLGVSTVTGRPRERAMMADAVCRAAGRDDVPVWSGIEKPLLVEQRQREAPQAEALEGRSGRRDFPACEAVQRMRETIRANPGEVTLLTIGPMTNAAVLFAMDPEMPRMLKRLIAMAGWFFGAEHSEWNAGGDPHATAITLAADVPEMWLYGLDVTAQCQMPVDQCRARLRGGPLDLVAQMAEVWFRHRDRITFHDPLAAACIFEPDLCTYRRGRTRVELCDPDRLGATTLEEAPDGPHRIAETVDADGFFEHYFATVKRLQ